MLRIPSAIRHGHAPRPAALLVAALLAIATLAGCDQSTRLAGVTHVEAWQADVPARFTFPPIGLEEFVLERKQAGRVELVIHIGADGALEELGAERVEGLDRDSLEQLFAAIRHARFAPAMVDGRQVASIKRIALEFDPMASRLVANARLPEGMR